MSEQDARLEEFAGESKGEQQTRGQTESRFWGVTPEEWDLVDPDTVYEVNPNPKPDEEPNTYIEMDALDTELPWPRYFGERNASEYSGKTFTTGDTLFARITPCTENGKAALVPEMETRVGIGSTEFAVLSPNRERILPWYLFYVAKSYPVYNYAVSRMRGSTGRQRVPFSVFRRELDVALPPLEEQRKIASVLYTVDQAIQKTEEISEQMETVQRGLLRTLFGKGVTRDQAGPETKTERLGPKQFRVPDTWGVTNISSIGKVVTGDTPSTDDEDNFGGDLPFVTPETLSQGKYVNHSDRTLSESGRNEVKPVPEGSVMMDCIGSDMGKVAVAGREVATNQQINSVVIEDQGYLSDFLYYHLRILSDFIKSQAGQTATPIVNKSSFESFAIFKPPIEEQRSIVETLSIYDEGKRTNKEYLTKLKRLKQGLIQDLLSGEVRTHDRDIEVVDDVLQHG